MANFSWEEYEAYVAEGFKEGIRNAERAAAVTEGREEGREEGLEKGREEKETELVVTGYNNGFSIDQIAEFTGLPTSKIQEILNRAGRI